MNDVSVSTAPGGLKALVGKKQTRKVKFMGTDVVIKKLTVAEVLDIQEMAKVEEGKQQDEKDAFESLKYVIRLSCEDAHDLDDDDFNDLPLDELSKLSQEIMKYSGLGEPGK